MTKYRLSMRVLLIIVAVLFILLSIGPVQRMTARASAAIYMTVHYGDRDLRFQTLEYSTAFGTYMVSYRDRDGQSVGLQISSKRFPVFIMFDSLDPGA
ncbi:hypothetical protein [Paenibacillus methanolicus]|uniref:Uncharacterized protein n=1 Tax=Paenibacillus methanolicus TaxID=582686 RepID=A0A5S5BV35_9BACL|nr:hypothetical protein [Paenibacillus methanolicus]TYP70824.1 hypothetical protein BCM02_111332 [Paenibacillus methanolicus]